MQAGYREESTEDLEAEFEETIIVRSGEEDYEKLKNLPMLDGVEIKGNVKERDPTVPSWAKEPNKPPYSAAEVGAISSEEMQEIDLGELESMWEEA